MVDREVVEKIKIFMCTSHPILMNPFKVKIQNIMMLMLFIFFPEGLLSGCYRHTSMACFLMDILVALCTSYLDPPGKKLFHVRILKFWGFTLRGFPNIVCEVQIDNCIITTTSQSPPMLIFGRKRSDRHKSLFKANLTGFLGMGLKH